MISSSWLMWLEFHHHHHHPQPTLHAPACCVTPKHADRRRHSACFLLLLLISRLCQTNRKSPESRLTLSLTVNYSIEHCERARRTVHLCHKLFRPTRPWNSRIALYPPGTILWTAKKGTAPYLTAHQYGTSLHRGLPFGLLCPTNVNPSVDELHLVKFEDRSLALRTPFSFSTTVSSVVCFIEGEDSSADRRSAGFRTLLQSWMLTRCWRAPFRRVSPLANDLVYHFIPQ